MRDKKIYVKTIGISEKDYDFILNLRKKFEGTKDSKRTLSGILAYIIDFYRERKQKKLF